MVVGMCIGTTTEMLRQNPGVILKPDGLFHMNNSTTSSGISLILLYSSHSTTDQTKFEVTSEVTLRVAQTVMELFR